MEEGRAPRDAARKGDARGPFLTVEGAFTKGLLTMILGEPIAPGTGAIMRMLAILGATGRVLIRTGTSLMMMEIIICTLEAPDSMLFEAVLTLGVGILEEGLEVFSFDVLGFMDTTRSQTIPVRNDVRLEFMFEGARTGVTTLGLETLLRGTRPNAELLFRASLRTFLTTLMTVETEEVAHMRRLGEVGSQTDLRSLECATTTQETEGGGGGMRLNVGLMNGAGGTTENVPIEGVFLPTRMTIRPPLLTRETAGEGLALLALVEVEAVIIIAERTGEVLLAVVAALPT